MGTRLGMKHVQLGERPHVQLFTSHTNVIKYSYMWCIHYKQVKSIWLHLEFTLNMFHPYTCPHTFFTRESSLHFLKFFYVLVYLLFWWPLATWNDFSIDLWSEFWVCYLTSINSHSYIFAVCVFSIPLQAHSQKQRESWTESNSLKHFLSVMSQSLRQLDSWLLSLIYKSEVYIIPYRRATWCIHRQQWEEEVTDVQK